MRKAIQRAGESQASTRQAPCSAASLSRVGNCRHGGGFRAFGADNQAAPAPGSPPQLIPGNHAYNFAADEYVEITLDFQYWDADADAFATDWRILSSTQMNENISVTDTLLKSWPRTRAERQNIQHSWKCYRGIDNYVVELELVIIDRQGHESVALPATIECNYD